MQSHGSNDRSEPEAVGGSPADEAGRAGPRPSAPVPRGYAWLWAAVAGVLAGLLAWVGQEKAYGHFKPQFKLPANFATMSPYEKTDVLSDLTRKATPAAE